MQKNVLIFGEFPPNTHTGISICNKMVSDVLSNSNYIVNVIEEFSWNKRRTNKIFHFIGNYQKVLRFLWKNKVSIFYFNLPLSISAMLKIAPIVVLLRVFSRSTKIVAHLHRGDFMSFVNEKLINKLITKFYLNRLEKLIILSKEFISSIKEFSSKIKIEVLHNTSIFENKIAPKKEFSNKYVCIANYIESKGIKELFNVFNTKEYQYLNLSIYGNPYDKKLLNEIKIKCPSNITINGPIEHNQIIDVFKENDCLILPSWNEGQPIIILEAMSIGVPIIATRVGDISNVLGNSYDFMIAPQDQESIRQTILKFQNKDNKNEIGEYLHNRYLQHYSNSIFKKRLIEIFESL